MASGITKHLVFQAFATIVLAGFVAAALGEALAPSIALFIGRSSQCSRLPCFYICYHQIFGWKGFKLVSGIEGVQVSLFFYIGTLLHWAQLTP